MIRSSKSSARWLCGLLTLGAALQVLTAPQHSGRLSLRSKKVASQLAVGAQVKTGCFFWEADCVMSEVMCGKENMIIADIKENKCKRFIYFFNHANDHCSITEDRLQAYKECFWTELAVHVPDRSKCGEVCADAHGHLPHEVEVCDSQCIHVHECTDECKTDKYKFRDPIMECFQTCMQRSPVNPVGTCIGSCGGHSPNMKCHCDPTCSYTDDCCADYENYCLVDGMRWNESLPLPSKTFNLPGFNITGKDVKQMGDVPVADEVNVTAEIDQRIEKKQQQIYHTIEEKRRAQAFAKSQRAHGKAP